MCTVFKSQLLSQLSNTADYLDSQFSTVTYKYKYSVHYKKFKINYI